MELELKKHLEETMNDDISNVIELNGGLQNRVFSFNYAKIKLVARVTLAKKRTQEQLQAELAFMETIDLEFFNGNHINVQNRSEWNANIFQNWGRTIAKIHNVVSKTSKEFTRPFFFREAGQINPIPFLVYKVAPELAVVYESLKIELETFSITKDTFGLIHNDLHQGNFFVVENELILFDFDDCAYNWYAQDLAVSLYHALWTGESCHPDWTEFHEVFITNFFEGYTLYRSITEDDMKLVSIFLRMRELFLFLLFKSTWDLDCLQEWQKNKLIELNDSIRQGTVPYIEVLKKYGHFIT